jgi:hypothetical protein
MKTFLRSIMAGVAGVVVGASLSIGTDKLLESTGLLPGDDLWVSAGVIWAVLGYRTVYNALGSYVVARLAPRRPMRHALVLGAFGTFVSALGAIATKDMNLGPMWYPWTLAALTMPAAWLGGWMFVRNLPKAAAPAAMPPAAPQA